MDSRLSYAGDKVWRHYKKMNLKEFYEDTWEAKIFTSGNQKERLDKRFENGVRS